jgi:hypothetical protein
VLFPGNGGENRRIKVILERRPLKEWWIPQIEGLQMVFTKIGRSARSRKNTQLQRWLFNNKKKWIRLILLYLQCTCDFLKECQRVLTQIHDLWVGNRIGPTCGRPNHVVSPVLEIIPMAIGESV